MPLALAAVLIVSTCVQDLPVRGRCTFESEGLRVVLDGLSACGDDEAAIDAAEEALARHRDLHGWGWRDSFDLVAGDQQAKCRAEDLDLLRSMAIPCGESSLSWVHREIAQCMERNGLPDREQLPRLDDLLAKTGRNALRPALDKLEALAGERVKYSKDTWLEVSERRARLALP